MAKYTRFDPRNKKKDRNKLRSIERDIRIHEEDKKQKYRYTRVDWEYNEEDEEDFMARN